MANSITHSWTTGACRELEKLWNETTMSASEIGRVISAMLGRPIGKNSVIGQVFRMRKRGIAMKRRASTWAERDKLMAEREATKKKVVGIATGDPVFEGWPQRGECAWPIGDPGTEGFRFCREKRSHRLYCDPHVAMAYRGKDEPA